MEDRIEVGEYVRTKDGLIGKIKEFIPHYTKGKREGQEVEENYLLMGQEQCEFIESIDYRIPPCYPSDEEWEKIKKYIVKHSKKLKDLIECGDFVNGYKVISVDYDVMNDTTECIELDLNSNYQYNFISIRQIQTILTKEQYEANCYKVGGEENETSND